MTRRASVLAVILSVFVSTLPHAAPPTDAEIQAAIKQLNDKRFAVREKASKFLWQAGKAAEPALRQAMKSDDPETTRRARNILDKFDWGIFAETPKEIAELVDQYRQGDREIRFAVVGKLIAQGRAGFETLKRLAAREPNEAERTAIFTHMSQNAQRAVPALLLAGDLTFAEEMLELALAGDADAAATNYAALQYLRGTLDTSIKRWDKEWKSTQSPRTGHLLVHLYRAKGNFAAARDLAVQMKSEALVEQILWEQGNWKELSAHFRRQGFAPREALPLGMKAAIHRLAGEADEFQRSVAELKKLGDTDDRFDNQSAAEALLLNGKSAVALELLLDKKRNPALTFDLLCEQRRYKDAFALAREVKLPDGDESFNLELRRARMLYLLGEKDEAVQLFTKLGEGLTSAGQSTAARDLIKVLSRLGLKERAAEVAVRQAAFVDPQAAVEERDKLLDPIFDTKSGAAEAWWRHLARKFPKDNPGAVMRKVRLLLDGKPVEGRDDWAAELANTQPAAAAEAMLAAGNVELARQYFAKAAEAKPPSASALLRYADFLVAQKRYKEAADNYASAGKADPTQAIAFFLQGSALNKAGDAKEGKRWMNLAHWIPLGDERARGQFADELEKRGFLDEARRERDFVLAFGWYRQWHVGNVLNQASRMALQRREYDKAVALIDKGIVGCMRMGASFVERSAYLIVPQSAAQSRARALLAGGKVDAALKEAQASLEVLPGNLELVIALVPALDKAGRKKDADDLFGKMLAHYEKLSQDYPNSAYAHNSCAWLAANCRRELDRALTHAQTAVKLEPKGAGYLDTLAEVHFRRGENDRAIEAMQECVAREPSNSYFRKQLERFKKGDANSEVPEAEED